MANGQSALGPSLAVTQEHFAGGFEKGRILAHNCLQYTGNMSRNRSRFLKCSFIFLYVLLGTCVAVEQSSDEGIVITEQQANQTISAHRGETITIKLPTQPGTGYSWQFSSKNSKVAAFEGQPEIVPDGNVKPGGVETQVFHVRIRRGGKARLVMKYIRPWEKQASPQKTFTITVHVQG